MLFSIALKNVKKSFKDYTIYFLTLTIAVSIFYSFNSFDSSSINYLESNYLESLNKILSIVSVFVAFILSGLILYANNFLIKRRKKEFALYMILGMGKNKVSKILIYETVIVGIVALITGLILGLFTSQGLFIILSKILDLNIIQFKLSFSLVAMAKTVLYFSIMFLIAILFNKLIISRYRIIDLLNAEKKTEERGTINPLIYLITFISSIILLIIAYTLILKNGLVVTTPQFKYSILLGIMGTILFFYGGTSTIVYLAKKTENFYFKKLNIFLVKQIDSKIRTNFISMSVISLMLFLTITLLSTGFSWKEAVDSGLEDSTPFDASMYMYVNSEDKIKEMETLFDQENIILEDDENLVFYNEYVDGTTLLDIMPLKNEKLDYKVSFIKLSDYNNIQKLEQKEPISLDNNEVIVSSNVSAVVNGINKYMASSRILTLGDQTYTIKNNHINEENLKTSESKSNFITVIINDHFLEETPIYTSILNINFKNENSKERFETILEKFTLDEISNEDAGFVTGVTREMVFTTNKMFTTTILFVVLYLGIIFLVSSMAILALQQLSEASENIIRYQSLKRLGANNHSIKQSIFKQTFIYFSFPISVALVHSIVGIKVMSDVIALFNTSNILGSSLIIVGFLLFIYFIYFYTTYKSYKNIVMTKI
ncbi:MAG: ABC transporter permease [Tetragenococcus koreensis]|nr:ABC transporter permease [Tetragenococcus koreensis]